MGYGKLYLVATPIGNLKDITLRALETLKFVDIIAAEDTRNSLKLLNHFEIKKTLISYHQHNELGKSDELIGKLKDGLNIALVTDAGMPGISDPGSIIVKRCIDEDIPFEVLPGATAFATALVYSGLDTTKFVFKGFLPREDKDRRPLVEEMKDRTETIILYEAPHRILNTLSFLKDNLGNRKVSICRELTKLYEQVLRTDIQGAYEYFMNSTPRGEFVIVIQGKPLEEIEEERISKWDKLTIEEHIKKYITEGMDKKDAIKAVAKDRKVTKSDIYRHSIEL
jgi:16S rRNA (cytidine1402-2'-O)-methyltransferase